MSRTHNRLGAWCLVVVAPLVLATAYLWLTSMSHVERPRPEVAAAAFVVLIPGFFGIGMLLHSVRARVLATLVYVPVALLALFMYLIMYSCIILKDCL